MQDVIELATPDVALHLLIPFVVVPTVQPRRKLGPLFEGELLNCTLDLGQAHRPRLSRRRRFSNSRTGIIRAQLSGPECQWHAIRRGREAIIEIASKYLVAIWDISRQRENVARIFGTMKIFEISFNSRADLERQIRAFDKQHPGAKLDQSHIKRTAARAIEMDNDGKTVGQRLTGKIGYTGTA